MYDYNDSTFVNENISFNKFMTKTFGMMFLGILVTGILALYGLPILISLARTLGNFSIWAIYLVQIGVTIFFSVRFMKMSKVTAMVCYFVYCAITGITLSTLPLYYDGGTLALALFMTAVMFGCMCIIGHTSKVDFTKFGPYLTMGLMAMIVMTLINVFFIHSSTMDLFIDYTVIIVFLIMIAYDMQSLRRMYSMSSYDSELRNKLAVMGAFSIYLDFINIFLRIVSILGGRDND